jgi:hypothetical protein
VPKKKSGKRAAREFGASIMRIEKFLAEIEASTLSAQSRTWAYEAAIIKTAVAFEKLMLSCLVTAINNDTATIADRTGVVFPKHLTDEVCEFLVTGGGFFDFKGRSGLIATVKKFVPENHWLVNVVKKPTYRVPLDRLIALRNFAAHESAAGKRALGMVINQDRVRPAGVWAKTQGRFVQLLGSLRDLANDIEAAAPY